jgi:hypothetical protein
MNWTDLHLSIDSDGDVFTFVIRFRFGLEVWFGSGTAPTLESAFDEAMDYLERTCSG